MPDLSKGARLTVQTCMQVKPGENVLILADNYARPMRIAEAIMDEVLAVGAEPVMAVMRPAEIAGAEPPKPVAAAMKTADAILLVSDKAGLGHSNARKEAQEAGARWYAMLEISEDEFARDLAPADLILVKKNTEKVAQRLTRAKQAKVTSLAGTDITMSLEGRQGFALHPLGRRGGMPDYAEAATSPLEGTAEGIIVVDAEMIGWGFLLREPLRLVVRAGRVVDVSGPAEETRMLKQILTADKNANNIAEFAIGTSHLIPKILRGTRRDAGISGMVHIAMGRSDTVGGVTWSSIHIDGVQTRATVTLDGEQIVRDGVLLLDS